MSKKTWTCLYWGQLSATAPVHRNHFHLKGRKDELGDVSPQWQISLVASSYIRDSFSSPSPTSTSSVSTALIQIFSLEVKKKWCYAKQQRAFLRSNSASMPLLHGCFLSVLYWLFSHFWTVFVDAFLSSKGMREFASTMKCTCSFLQENVA